MNQGRQIIGKGITDLFEAVKNKSTSSDSSMMIYLSAEDSTRRFEMEDRQLRTLTDAVEVDNGVNNGTYGN